MPRKKKPDNVVHLHDKRTLKRILDRMPAEQPPPDADEDHYKELLEEIEESFWKAFSDYEVESEDAARLLTVMIVKMICGGGAQLEDVVMAAVMAKQLIDIAADEQTE
jgi:hypothetical protein